MKLAELGRYIGIRDSHTGDNNSQYYAVYTQKVEHSIIEPYILCKILLVVSPQLSQVHHRWHKPMHLPVYVNGTEVGRTYVGLLYRLNSVPK